MTANASQSRISSVDQIDIVVDCDFHLSEGPEQILPYIEEPWNEILSINPDSKGYSGGADIYPSPAILHPGRTTGRIKVDSVTTPEDVREGMTEHGIDYSVLTPGQNLLLAAVHHEELAVSVASAYNDWFLDTFADEGLKGALVIAPHKPVDAAEEIKRRAGEDAFVSVMLPSAGAYPPLGHESYDPIYAACQDADLPLMLHGTAASTWLNFPHLHQGLRRHLSLHTLGHPVEHMMHLASMIAQGVPVRFPEQDFVFQEAGLGWIPYLMYRLDHEYPMKPEDAPILDKRPSEYVRDQFYFTSQPVEGIDKPEYVQSIIRSFGGEDNLLFSSDYPHHDFDNSNELLRHIQAEFADEDIEAIYGGNAMALFDF